MFENYREKIICSLYTENAIPELSKKSNTQIIESYVLSITKRLRHNPKTMCHFRRPPNLWEKIKQDFAEEKQKYENI